MSVVQQLSLARDLLTVMSIVREAARRLTGADGASFVLQEGDSCYYADEAAIGPLWKGQRFPKSACISGWVMNHRAPAVIEDIFADPRIPTEAYRPTFVKSLLIVPIRTMEPIGAIGNYWATPHRATEEEVSLLQALADTTAVAMENVQVYEALELRVKERTAALKATNERLRAEVGQRRRAEEQLRRISLTDPLTGLLNRRGFFEYVERELDRARRSESKYVIIYADLDGLKRVNDCWGHEAGDAVIEATARILKSTFRKGGTIARLGGDEFAVFVDGEEPESIRDRLRNQVVRHNRTALPPLRVSISYGIMSELGDASLQALLDQADKQMYRQKLDKRKDIVEGVDQRVEGGTV